MNLNFGYVNAQYQQSESMGRSGGGQREVRERSGGGQGEVRGEVCLMQFNSMHVSIQDLVVHRHHSLAVMLVHSLVCVANSV